MKNLNNYNLENLLNDREIVRSDDIVELVTKSIYDNISLPEQTDRMQFDISKRLIGFMSPYMSKSDNSRNNNITMSVKNVYETECGININVQPISNKLKEVESMAQIINELKESKKIIDKINEHDPSLETINISKNIDSSLKKAYMVMGSVTIGELDF